MRTRIKLLLAAAVVAVVAMLPAGASAHWQSRQVFDNGAFWAIHYRMNAYATGVEYFSSLGGFFSSPYNVQVYDATTGQILCGTGWIQPAFQARHKMFCSGDFTGNNPPYDFGGLAGGRWGDDFRCRIQTPSYWPYNHAIGYYCRDMYNAVVPVP